MTVQIESADRRFPLPMLHQTRGKRSAVTCHLKCDDACTKPVPNQTDNPTFREVAGTAFTRRLLLQGVGVGALAVVFGGAFGATPEADATGLPASGAGAGAGAGWGPGRSPLRFAPIAPVDATVDAMTVPSGFQWSTILRWGDPLFSAADTFDVGAQTADLQARQFGYNNDYTDIIVIPGTRGREALLVCNHEYVNPGIMFATSTDEAVLTERRKVAQQAHGMSVVHLHRNSRGTPWTYTVGSKYNRRVTATTPFSFTGPAAGSALLKTTADPSGTTVFGTLGNCAGGTTPWGTVLSGEENFNGYFRAAGLSAEEARYGLADKASANGWELIDPRFDARSSGTANEVNRFGWIVEIDPFQPDSTPVKHTAMGRLKHEGANVIVGKSGHVAAYMGDDERFDYLYKFVSADTVRGGWSCGHHEPRKYSRSDREHNKTLLHSGSLYVARFTGDSPVAEFDGTGALPSDGSFDGTGEWLPIVLDGVSQVPGFSVEEALVHTRLAADALGATKMDRCEDVQPNPMTGKVYVACTNNSDRGKVGKEGATEVNPRNANRDGHIVEITEDRHDPRSTTFRWSLLLVCGDPSVNSSTYFAGFPADQVSPIACPDNVAFDSVGNLWIATDGAPSAIARADGLFKVPLTGGERGHVQQFLAVPRDAETCGPVIHDQDGLVFVAVQHPGEEGTFDAQRSYFPDYVAEGAVAGAGAWRGPRPAIVQVWKS